MTEIPNPDMLVYPIEANSENLRRRRIVTGAALGLITGLAMAKGVGYVDDHFVDLVAKDRQCAASLLRGSDQEVADDCFDTEVEAFMDRTWAYEQGEFKLIYHLDRAEMATKQLAYVESQDKISRSIRRSAQAIFIAGGILFGALEGTAWSRRRKEKHSQH